MSTVVNPFDSTDAWDALTIAVTGGGTFQWLDLPVDFDGDLVNEYDVQKPKGADGGRAKDLGYIPAQITVKWLICNAKHFDLFQRFVAAVVPKPGLKAKPVISISHPMLQMYGLAKFNVEKTPFLSFKEVDQWEAKLAVVQWFAEPKPTKPAEGPPADPPPLRQHHLYDATYAFKNERPSPPLPSSSVKPT